jgi:hypothetical protein
MGEKLDEDKEDDDQDLEVFELMIHKLKKEFREIYFVKEDIDPVKTQIDELEVKIKELTDLNDILDKDLDTKATYCSMKEAMDKLRINLMKNSRPSSSVPMPTVFKTDGKIDNETLQ